MKLTGSGVTRSVILAAPPYTTMYRNAAGSLFLKGGEDQFGPAPPGQWWACDLDARAVAAVIHGAADPWEMPFDFRTDHHPADEVFYLEIKK